ncbi:hypothetical protein PO909_014699, partial [Leuciscus waleckii]
LGTEVVKAVGEEVSFGPDKPPPPPVSSITWKHIKGAETVKAIEWEDGVTDTPNPRFKGITTLDTATGQITIKNLKLEHSGVYTIDISGKEQAQRYTLTVMEPVPKPEIKVVQSGNPGVVYLSCEYNATVIWKNSAGQTLTGSEFENTITVEKNGNPEDYYTCTLENKASKKTSEPVYEREIFKDQSEGGHSGTIVAIVVFIVIIVIIVIICGILYKRNKKFKGKFPFVFYLLEYKYFAYKLFLMRQKCICLCYDYLKK